MHLGFNSAKNVCPQSLLSLLHSSPNHVQKMLEKRQSGSSSTSQTGELCYLLVFYFHFIPLDLVVYGIASCAWLSAFVQGFAHPPRSPVHQRWYSPFLLISLELVSFTY